MMAPMHTATPVPTPFTGTYGQCCA
jgi:hypothetical protein